MPIKTTIVNYNRFSFGQNVELQANSNSSQSGRTCHIIKGCNPSGDNSTHSYGRNVSIADRSHVVHQQASAKSSMTKCAFKQTGADLDGGTSHAQKLWGSN